MLRHNFQTRFCFCFLGFKLLLGEVAFGQTEVLVKVVTGQPERGMASRISVSGVDSFIDHIKTEKRGSVLVSVPQCDLTTSFSVDPVEFFYSNEFGHCENDVTKFITKPMNHASALDAISQISVLELESGSFLIERGTGGPDEPTLNDLTERGIVSKIDPISGTITVSVDGKEHELKYFNATDGVIENLLSTQRYLAAGNTARAALAASEVAAHLRKSDNPYLAKAFSFAAMDYAFRALGYNPARGTRPLLQYDSEQHGYFMTPAGSEVLRTFQSRQGIPVNGQWDHKSFLNLRFQKPVSVEPDSIPTPKPAPAPGESGNGEGRGGKAGGGKAGGGNVGGGNVGGGNVGGGNVGGGNVEGGGGNEGPTGVCIRCEEGTPNLAPTDGVMIESSPTEPSITFSPAGPSSTGGTVGATTNDGTDIIE